MVKPAEETLRGPTDSAPRLDVRANLAALALSVFTAAASLAIFYSLGVTNLLGDGIAHMEGARRLFDSVNPGYATIGTVWLPLYHILASPLALNDFLWRTGLAGSLLSALSFALAGWVLFRFAFELTGNTTAAAVALAGFLVCPSMDYIASTPLTEPLAILFSVLVVYGVFRYGRSGRVATLVWAGLAAFAGTLTRYDGWYLLPFAAIFVLFARRENWRARFLRTSLFSVIAGLGPALWLVHNAVRFGSPIEFYKGPGSAWAIYQQQLATSGFRYPTDGSFILSALYYLGDLVVVIGPCAVVLAILGFVAWVADRQRRAPRAAVLLLLVPFVFYVQSMARAAVPIYIPILPPFSYYNLRYGLEMLPAVALFPSFLVGLGITGRRRAATVAVVIGLIAVEAGFMVRKGAAALPVVHESVRNNPCQAGRQQALIVLFRREYDGEIVLMSPGEWLCLNPAIQLPFRKTWSDTNVQTSIKLSSAVPSSVGWIIRGEDDPVDQLMRANPGAFGGFTLVERDEFPHEGWVEVYRRRGGGP